MEELREKLSGLLIARGRRRWRTRFMRTVAILVVFVTTYTMVMPALTLDENTVETAAGISLDEGKSEKKAETKKSKKKSKKKSSKKKSEKKEETEDDSAIKPAADKVKAKIGGAELTISYSKKAGLPKDVSVVVTEYSPNSDDKDNRAAYDTYFAMAQKKALDKGADEVTLARFFALQFFAGNQELVPEEGVKISVKYDKSLKLADDETYKAVQFGKDSAKLLKTTTKGGRKLTKASFTLKKFPGLGLIVTRKEAETKAAETEAAKVNEEAKEAAADVQEAEVVTEAPEKAEPEIITEAPEEDAEPAAKEIVTQAPEEEEKADQADQANAEPAKEATVETADITEAAIAMAGIAADATAAEEAQPEVAAEKAEEADEPAEEAADEEDAEEGQTSEVISDADEDDEAAEADAEEADAEEPEDGLTSEVISDAEEADEDEAAEADEDAAIEETEAAAAEDATDESATEEAASDEDAAADESALEETTAGEASDESAIAETTATETTAVETTAEETTMEESSVEETTEEAVEEEVYEAGELTYDGDGYKVVLNYSAEAKIPADATLSVRELQEGTDEYEAYRAQAEAAVAAEPDKELTFARAFDIKIQAPVEVEVEAAADAEAGEAAETQAMMTETVIREIQPAVPVSVQILLDEAVEVAPADEVKALHVEANDGTAGISASDPEVTAVNDVDYDAAAEGEEPAEVKEVEFKADGFSVWMIVGTETLTTNYITAEGDTYTITVTYDKDAEIPEGATLEVSELANDNKEYTDYVEQAAKALAEGEEVPFVNAARVFDITIMADGEKIQPKAPVDVKIEYVNPERVDVTKEVGAVHFKEDSEELKAEVLDVEVENGKDNMQGVSFATNSFSIYAIVIIDKEEGSFIFEDEDFIVTVSYTKDANIPLGTRMTVRQVEFDTDEYWTLWDQTIEKLNKGVEWNSDGDEPDPRKGLADAAFFDVTFDHEGKTVEPDVPVKVDIRYKKYGIIAPAGETAGAVHIDGDTVELIDNVDVVYGECDTETQQFYVGGASEAQQYTYAQKDFSYTGTYVTGEYIDQDAPIFRTSSPVLSDSSALKAQLEAKTQALADAGIQLRAAGDSEVPKPASNKKLESNGDGTYTLSLSVTGKADTGSEVQVDKSNVIIVMDRSNSMVNNNTYVEYTYNAATYSSSNQYFRLRNNGSYSQVYYRNGAWRTSNSNNGTIHNGTVYQYMNRLEAEQQALDSVVQSLLSNNTPGDPDLSDVIEIAVTSYNLRSPGLNSSNQAIADVIDSTDYSTIMSAINNDGHHEATNWDEGLQHALSIANTWKQSEPGEQVYVIFLTDGEPTASQGDTTYTTGNTAYWRHWSNANTQATAIVNAGYEFYSIFTYGTNNTFINYLNNLTRSANGAGSYTQNNFGNTNTYHDNFFNATDTSELVEAFNAIVDHINNALGLAGVSIEDGIATDVTHTALSTSVGGGSINGVTYSKTGGSTASFTVKVGSNGVPVYTVNGSTYNGTTTTVNYDKIVEGSDPVTTTPATTTVYTADASEKNYLMPMATLDGGELEWDLAPLGMLEDGATYTISFIVWPDQDAYDYVANLNNGISGYTWDESTQQPVYASDGTTVLYYTHGVDGMPNIVKYPSGVFAALTNTHQDLNYYVYENEEHEDGTTETTYTEGEPVHLPVPTPMRLTSSGAKLTKKWNSELQMVQLARLLYNTRTGDSQEKAIPFAVKQDGEDYKTVTLGWNGDAYDWAETEDELITVTDNGNTFKLGTMWQEDFALATGIMLSADKMAERGLDTSKYPSGTYNGTTYYLLERGHTYEVEEPDLGTYNFDMETMLYHPMLVDGTLMNVTFTVSGSTLTITDSKEMNDGIRIDNTLRGGINLNKIVTETINGVSQEINSNEKFEFTITLNNDAAPFSGDQIPWYAVNGNYYHDADGNYIAESATGDTDGDGLEDDGNIMTVSNSDKTATATLKITNSDTVRIANVPAGTTYTVTETAKDGYELVKIEKNIVIDGETEDSEEKTSGNTMDGEIVPNRENNITFTNDTKSYEVKLRKVDEDENRLAGAKFNVYSDEECKTIAKDKNGAEIGELNTAADSDVLIGTLTPGTYYLKETTAPTNYEAIEDPIAFTLTRNGDGTATVTSASSAVTIKVVEGVNVIVVENIHEKGNLKVSKTVVSDLAADANREFAFTVTLDDTTISGTYGDMEFTNGVATFSLKDGENVTATGLPTTVGYTVTETEVTGFSTTKAGETGTITKDETPEAAFTNTRQTGDLEVSKTVVSDLAADTNQEFSFTVTLGDTTISGTYGDVTFENGVATFNLKGGEKVGITGLPTTVTYTVEETTNNGFNTTKTGDSGTISTTKSTAAFTNTRKTGGLEITKTVASSTNADKQKDFSFTVTLGDTTINGTYGEVTFTDGIANFTLKHGETRTITGLPISLEYTVTEAEAAGFVTTRTGDTGTINTELSIAAFTNTRDEGGLVVSKTVVSNLEADKDVDFEFTVTLSDTSINETYNGVEFRNGVATFTIKDGDTKNITGLPTGLTYTVVETEDDRFTTEKSGDTGTISTTASTAAFTNTRQTGDLNVNKRVVSDLAADKDQSFIFTITLVYGEGENEQKLSGTYNVTGSDEVVTFDENGQGTITLKHGESKTIEGLPIGVSYTVVETANEDFTTEKTGDTGTITTTLSTAAFTNTRKTGDLEVSKTVVSDLAEDADVEFEFTVTLSDTTISKSYSGTKTDKEGTESEITVAFTEGAATVTLKDGEKVSITGLPTDVSYTVVETANEDFTTEKTGDTGTITTTISTAAFMNTRKTIDVNILKVDENGTALTGASFSLTQVDNLGHTVPGGISQSGTVDKDGKLTFNKLVAGKYQLLETKCPDGYIKLSDAPIFEIKNDEGTGDLVVIFTESELVKYDSDTITFTVMNIPGQALPMTGGSGTLPYTLGGIALIMASALMYGFSMRRRERRYK